MRVLALLSWPLLGDSFEQERLPLRLRPTSVLTTLEARRWVSQRMNHDRLGFWGLLAELHHLACVQVLRPGQRGVLIVGNPAPLKGLATSPITTVEVLLA